MKQTFNAQIVKCQHTKNKNAQIKEPTNKIFKKSEVIKRVRKMKPSKKKTHTHNAQTQREKTTGNAYTENVWKQLFSQNILIH